MLIHPINLVIVELEHETIEKEEIIYYIATGEQRVNEVEKLIPPPKICKTRIIKKLVIKIKLGIISNCYLEVAKIPPGW